MNLDKFKEILENNHSWPGEYIFRFIIPFTEQSELERILGREGMSIKPSKNGNYLSVILIKNMNSAEEVISYYQDVSQIKGIISI
jgi:uncharacterized protein